MSQMTADNNNHNSGFNTTVSFFDTDFPVFFLPVLCDRAQVSLHLRGP